MELFTYLMAKNDHNTSVKKDLFSYLLGKNQSGTYTEFTGTSISANNTKKGKMKVNLLGNTSQTGTPTPSSPIPVNVVSGDNTIKVEGKNLLDLEDGTFTDGSNLTIKIENQKVILNGTTSNDYLWLNLTKKDYRYGTPNTSNKPSWFSGAIIKAGTYIGSISDDNITFNVCQSDGSRNAKTNISSPYDICSACLYIGASGTTFNNKEITLQIEKGSTATSYEPYDGDTYELDLGVKNLYNKNGNLNYPTTAWGDGTTLQEDGTLKTVANFSSSSSRGFRLSLNQNTNYTISGNLISSTGTGASSIAVVRVMAYSSSWSAIQNIELTTIGKFSYTFNSGNNTDWFISLNTNGASGGSYQAIYDEIQVEEGSKQNSYSPFGQTPIKMRGIGTYEDYFVRNSGKNLLDSSDLVIGSINANGEEVYANNRARSLYIEVKENTTYKFSSSNSNIYFVPYFYDSSKTFISYDSGWKAQTSSITIPSNTKYLRIILKNNNTDTITLEEITRPMLNEGSSALPYEPYGTGQWCKYNAIEERILNGTENWSIQATWSAVGNKTNAFYITKPAEINQQQPCYCDYLKYVQPTTIVTTDEYGISYSASLILRMPKSITNGNALNTYLANNNMKMCYALSTPYSSLIENETLQSQLDAIEKALSKDGQTNISQDNNDKPFNLDVEIKVGS